MNDPAKQSATELVIVLKEELDEWIDGELNEFDDTGSLYKKLEYQTTGEVFKKKLYNKNNSIKKSETAKPYQSIISITNYCSYYLLILIPFCEALLRHHCYYTA
ncbi:MAG: hypothetical protein LH615_09870 [Ferruginibacter sp.]|nr:hypothetical protein [Ferruginibacter sp.]